MSEKYSGCNCTLNLRHEYDDKMDRLKAHSHYINCFTKTYLLCELYYSAVLLKGLVLTCLSLLLASFSVYMHGIEMAN